MPVPPLLRLVILSCIAATLVACNPIPSTETLFQASTISALQAGVFDGDLPITALKRHGDFGVGTFNALDGEMVMVDGEIYQIKADGRTQIAADGLYTPFAAVTFFAADQTALIDKALACSALQAHLDMLLPDLERPYAIKLTGEWAILTLRAPLPEEQPYPTLAEALADQVVFEFTQDSGTMVGFRLPDYLNGVNSIGYHFHYLSADRQRGGHVLDCQAGALTIEIDQIDDVQIDLLPPQ